MLNSSKSTILRKTNKIFGKDIGAPALANKRLYMRIYHYYYFPLSAAEGDVNRKIEFFRLKKANEILIFGGFYISCP